MVYNIYVSNIQNNTFPFKVTNQSAVQRTVTLLPFQTQIIGSDEYANALGLICGLQQQGQVSLASGGVLADFLPVVGNSANPNDLI